MQALRGRSALKTAVRRAVRATGYDLTPFLTGFSTLQRHLLDQIDLVVDVGANTGQYAEKVRQLGYEGRVLSFEPGAAAFFVLAKRLQPPRWEGRQLALGREEGIATLRVSGNSVSSSLLNIRKEHIAAAPSSAVVGTEQVPLTTLDAQLQGEKSQRMWLKIDVQGAEMAVLDGAVSSLNRVQVVQVELSFSSLYDEQTDYLALCGVLREHGLLLVHFEPGFQDPKSGRLLQADGLFARDGT